MEIPIGNLVTQDEKQTAIACARQDISDTVDAVRCGYKARALYFLACAERHMTELWECMQPGLDKAD